jgi:hypothetical protein
MLTIEERMVEMLERLARCAPAELIDQARTEVGYGEYGIGLENLCEGLYEVNAKLPQDILDSIAELAGAMDLSPERWEFVEILLDEDPLSPQRDDPAC